jgi:hypothetical protein
LVDRALLPLIDSPSRGGDYRSSRTHSAQRLALPRRWNLHFSQAYEGSFTAKRRDLALNASVGRRPILQPSNNPPGIN